MVDVIVGGLLLTAVAYISKGLKLGWGKGGSGGGGSTGGGSTGGDSGGGTGGTALDFSAWPLGQCVPDNSSFGVWTSQYNGYGCNKSISAAVVQESPKASTSAGETHGGLILGPDHTGDITFQSDVLTVKQLRTGTPPNPWELAWIMWHYTDDDHHYYFTLKTNGWELGKVDPAYPGRQRYLATGTNLKASIGSWYTLKIVQVSNSIAAFVNGQQVATFVDNERPYTFGRVGLYNEDSTVQFKNVSVQ